MKRIMTLCVSLLLCAVMGASVSAQGGYEVKGVVVDAIGPVIGATVAEKNYWGIACFRYNNTGNFEGKAWYIGADNTLMMLEL